MSVDMRRPSEVNRQKCWSDDLVTIDANFACQLERELNAANAEIEEKRKDVVWLATEKAKLEERIKRLEEAGDRMVNEGWNEPHLANAWRKAKEAKL